MESRSRPNHALCRLMTLVLGPVSSAISIAALLYLTTCTTASASLINFAGSDGDDVDLYQRCIDELGGDFCDAFMTPGGALSGLVDLFDPILQRPGEDEDQDQDSIEEQPVEGVDLTVTSGNMTLPSVIVSGNETVVVPSPSPAPTTATPPLSSPSLPSRPPLTDNVIRKAVNFYLDEPGVAQKILGPISSWNTSLVTDFDALFYNADEFNEDLSRWDTSSASSMTLMFFGAASFEQSLCWTVSNDTDVTEMFCESLGSFDSACVSEDIALTSARCPTPAPTSSPTVPVIVPITDDNIHEAVDLWLTDQGEATEIYGPLQNWDTANVTDMSSLFEGATTFNHFIENWNVSGVVTMEDMFRECTKFNRDLGRWDVSNVVSMRRMFDGASSFVGYGLENWIVSSVTDMSALFHYAESFQGNISGWDVSSVMNMGYCFLGAAKFNGDLSLWSVSRATSLTYMFHEASHFNGDIGRWNVSSATDLEGMFYSAKTFGRTLCWNLTEGVSVNAMFCDSGGGSLDTSCADAELVEAALKCNLETSSASQWARTIPAFVGMASTLMLLDI